MNHSTMEHHTGTSMKADMLLSASNINNNNKPSMLFLSNHPNGQVRVANRNLSFYILSYYNVLLLH